MYQVYIYIQYNSAVYNYGINFPSVAPTVMDQAINYRAIIQETISLTCIADGVPLPDIVWLKDGCPLSVHISQSSQLNITESIVPGFRAHVPEAKQSILTIKDISGKNEGAYSCRATNVIDSAYLPVSHQVIVDSKPVNNNYYCFMIYFHKTMPFSCSCDC